MPAQGALAVPLCPDEADDCLDDSVGDLGMQVDAVVRMNVNINAHIPRELAQLRVVRFDHADLGLMAVWVLERDEVGVAVGHLVVDGHRVANGGQLVCQSQIGAVA